MGRRIKPNFLWNAVSFAMCSEYRINVGTGRAFTFRTGNMDNVQPIELFRLIPQLAASFPSDSGCIDRVPDHTQPFSHFLNASGFFPETCGIVFLPALL